MRIINVLVNGKFRTKLNLPTPLCAKGIQLRAYRLIADDIPPAHTFEKALFPNKDTIDLRFKPVKPAPS